MANVLSIARDIGFSVNYDTFDQRAAAVNQRYVQYASEREHWDIPAADDEDFMLGKQWTSAELALMNARKMPPVVVNRILPIIMHEVAMFTSRSPTFRALPRDDDDVAKAALWSDVLAYIWHISDGDLQLGQTAVDYFSKGLGYLYVYVDPLDDDGRGEVRIVSIPPWDVYVDPNSRNVDLSDASSIIVSKLVEKKKLLFMYPDLRKKILRAPTESGPVTDRPSANPDHNTEAGFGVAASDIEFVDVPYSGNDMVYGKCRLHEHFEKIRAPFYRVLDLNTGKTSVVPAESFDTEAADKSANIVYRKISRVAVKMTACIGDSVTLYETVLPTSTYPVVPFMLHHFRNPFPHGDVRLAKEQQRQANKLHSILLHNGMLTNNVRVMAERGAIVDKANWEDSQASASILEYNRGFQKPEQVMAGNIPALMLNLGQESKSDIEYTLSIFSTMMGSPQDAPDVYRSILALEEAGQKKLIHKMRNANHSLRVAGRVAMDFARAIYKTPKMMRIVGDDKTYKNFLVNGISADPLGGGVVKINDLSVGRFDLVVVDGTSMPTNRMALLNLYLDLYDRGIVDKETVLSKTDVTNREEVLARIGEIQNLANQVQSLQTSLKEQEGLNQTLRRMVQQSRINLEVEKGLDAVRDEVRQTKAEQLVLRNKLRSDAVLALKSLALKEKEVELDAREGMISLEAHKARLSETISKRRASNESAGK